MCWLGVKLVSDREWQRWDLLSTPETRFVPLLYLDWPISTSVGPVEEWRLMSQLHTDVIKGADYQDRHKTCRLFAYLLQPQPAER
jgi:hypothetical protein